MDRSQPHPLQGALDVGNAITSETINRGAVWARRFPIWSRWIMAEETLYPASRALGLASTAGTGISQTTGRLRIHRRYEIGARIGLAPEECDDGVAQLLADGWLIDRRRTAESDSAIIALPGRAWN